MRVAVYPADLGGCGYYRLIWPAEALRRLGKDVTIVLPDSDDAQLLTLMQDGVGAFGEPVPHVVGLDKVPEFDVVVFQRPLHMNLVQTIPHLQESGVAVVVELDDDFQALDPRNQVYPSVQPKLSPYSNWKWLAVACDLADGLTVSTDALARVYGRKREHMPTVLRNFLPPHAYSYGPKTDLPTNIGWTGGLNTHPADLPVMGSAIATSGLPFQVIGTGRGVARQLGIGESRLQTTEGWVPIEDYHAALDAIDIGVAPLADSTFNRSKSWLKGLEYAGRGIPNVGSPLPEYERLAGLGGCLTADSRKDWARTLKRLTDPGLYRDTAAKAHAAASELCIDNHALEWWDAWTYARAVRLAS